jgi:hypothetical protein
MPDFGIGEAVAGLADVFTGGDLLGALFGGGSAAAGTAGAATAAEALAPTALGTATDFLGQGTFDALSGSALAGTGADALGAAGSFLAAPEASILGASGGFNAAADTALASAAGSGLASGIGSILSPTAPIDAFLGATPTAGFGTTAIGGVPSPTSSAGSGLPSNIANSNASASVFDTGTAPITGTSTQPGTAGAGSVSAPSGVATIPDPTSAAAGAGSSGSQVASATGGQSSSIEQLLSKMSPTNLASGAIDSLTKNPLAVGLGAAGLGYNIFEGQKQTANEKALSADAATATANSNGLVAQGEALQQYLTSGTLPPQYMSQVDQAISNAKTTAISNAAQQGLPTDPTKNTALAATLANIDNQRPQMITQVASQLFSSGGSLVSAGQNAAGLSGELYRALVQNDTTQAGNIGKAIASLAAALNGKTQANIGGTTLQIAA